MAIDSAKRNASPLLSVAMLDGLRFQVGKRELRLGNRKCRALLAYLVLSDKGEEARERVIGMLWSEADEQHARASLRQALYEINTAFAEVGLAPIAATKLTVGLKHIPAAVDLLSVVDSARHEIAHPLLLDREQPIADLLADFENIDPGFRVWLLAKRQALHDRLVRYLEKAMCNEQNSADWRANAARAVSNLDNTHEESVRVLMQLRAASGDVGGALAIYKRLWDVLDEEYEVEPSKETQELVATLKLSQPETSHTIRLAVEIPPAIKPRLIVAVGQFDISAISPERSYFLQGFRHELIANLVRFREWSVRDGISRLASLEAASVPADHEYILEGAAFQDSAGYRLVITLLSLRDNEYVWSGEHQLTPEGWVDSQQTLVRRIASAMNVYLSAGRLAQVASHGHPQLKAYDRWLYGQSKLLTWSPQAFREARDIFLGIVAETPDFSPAYSTLAQLQNTAHLIHPGTYRSAESANLALSYAREAARLDPIDSRAQLSLGWAYAMAQQHDLAETHHLLARELNENDGWTATSVALGFAMRGKKEAAREAAAHALAVTLSPRPHHWVYRTQISCLTQAYEDAIQAANSVGGEFNPTLQAWKTAALGHIDSAQARDAGQMYLTQVAKIWHGEEPPSDENITRWTLHCFPIQEPSDWQAFRDGLGAAGLPVGSIQQLWM